MGKNVAPGHTQSVTLETEVYGIRFLCAQEPNASPTPLQFNTKNIEKNSLRFKLKVVCKSIMKTSLQKQKQNNPVCDNNFMLFKLCRAVKFPPASAASDTKPHREPRHEDAECPTPWAVSSWPQPSTQVPWVLLHREGT